MVWLCQLLDFGISRGRSGGKASLCAEVQVVYFLAALNAVSSAFSQGVPWCYSHFIKNGCVSKTVKRLRTFTARDDTEHAFIAAHSLQVGPIDWWVIADKSPPCSCVLGWTALSNFITYLLTLPVGFPTAVISASLALGLTASSNRDSPNPKSWLPWPWTSPQWEIRSGWRWKSAGSSRGGRAPALMRNANLLTPPRVARLKMEESSPALIL